MHVYKMKVILLKQIIYYVKLRMPYLLNMIPHPVIVVRSMHNSRTKYHNS